MDVVILGSGVEGLADCELLRSGFVIGSVALLGIDVAFGHRTPGTQMLAIEPFGTIDHLARLLRLSLPSVRLHDLATMAAQQLDQHHDGELRRTQRIHSPRTFPSAALLLRSSLPAGILVRRHVGNDAFSARPVMSCGDIEQHKNK